MNGRTYDPWLGRMLQPDNYVQAAGYLQNYNRYSYLLNNPLIYTDPTGEKWWHWALADVLTGGALSLTGITTISVTAATFQTSLPAIQTTMMSMDQSYSYFYGLATGDGSKFENATKIDAGLLLHIPGWESEQALIGNTISHARNITGNVDNVEINHGTVLVNDNNSKNPGGMTWGPYINSNNMNTNTDLYDHEFGHTIQSRILGPLYTTKVAMPSGLSALYSYEIKDDSGEYHDNCWYEVWANRLANVSNSTDYPYYYRHKGFYISGELFLPIFPY